MSDPPDPEFYCDPCVRKLEAEALQTGYLPTNWIPSKWELRVAKQLGLVRAGPRYAEWGHWFKPSVVPDGYEVFA